MKYVGILILACGLAVAGAVFLLPKLNVVKAETASVPSAPPPTAPEVKKYPVRVQPISAQPLKYTIHAVGALEAQDTYRIDSQVGGTIYSVSFNEGDEVKAGQVLLRIAPEAYRLNAARDEASYHQAVADLANTKRKNTNQIDMMKVQLKETETEISRRMAVRVAGAISEEEIQLYQSKRDMAKVQVTDSEQALETEIKALEATVEQKEAVWKVSLDDVRKSSVLPPIPGKIDKRYVTNGMYVTPGTPLATIVDRRSLKLRFKVSEMESAAVRNGDRVSFTVPAWPQRTFEATVYQVSDQLDTDARVVSCLARIDKDVDKLIPGYFASVELQSGGNTKAVVVPATAILTTEKGFVAFVLKNPAGDPIAEKRFVNVGLSVTDNQLEILSGLSEGETLVIEGASSLSDGYHANVLPQGNVVEQTPSTSLGAGVISK